MRSLRRQRAERGQRARRGSRRAGAPRRRREADRRRPARPTRRVARRRAPSCRSTSSRRRETPRDSSSLRPGASPSQNGMFGAAPCASSTRTRPGSIAQDALAGVAELEDVAGHALDREVLVDRADRRAPAARARPRSRPVSGIVPPEVSAVRRAPLRARSRRFTASRCSRPARGPWRVVKPSASMRTTASNSSRVELAVGPGAAHQREQLVLVPLAARDLGDDLLGEHVERRRRRCAARRARRAARSRAAPRTRPARRASAGTAAPSACRRPRGPSGRRAAGRSRSSAASRAGRPGRRRRCRCRARATRSRPAPSARRASAAARRRAAPRLREAAVVRGDRLLAEPLAEMARRALGHAPRVDEDQRRAVRAAPARRRGRRPAPTGRSTSPPTSGVGGTSSARSRSLARSRCRRSRSRRSAVARRPRRGADQEARDLLDRLLRRRQADAQRAAPCARTAPRAARATARGGCRACSPRRAWISSTITRAHRREHRAARRPSRAARRATPASSPGCAAACAARWRRSCGGVSPVRTAVRISTSGRPSARQLGADAGERRLEVQPDVVRQRLQRRDVDDRRLVGQAAGLQALRAPARRSRPGRRSASCPSRSARRPACAGRRGSPARRRPAPRSARRRCGGTRRRRRDGSLRRTSSGGAGSVGETHDSTGLRSGPTPAATLQFRAWRRISSRPTTGTAARPACGRRPPRVRSWPTSSSPSSPLRRSRPSWSASRRATASCPSRSSPPWPLSAPSVPSGPWAPSGPSPP